MFANHTLESFLYENLSHNLLIFFLFVPPALRNTVIYVYSVHLNKEVHSEPCKND